jgi:hypothetical protein
MIIGLAGAARAGKDTVAGILRRHGFTALGFADPLYDAMNAMFGWTREFIEAHKEEPIGPGGKSPRFLMQTLGTEWGRDTVASTLWIDLWKQNVRGIRKHVVAPGVRFEDEALAIRDMGGVVMRVVRPDAPAVRAHMSEAGVPDDLVSWEIVNDSTIEALERNVEWAMRTFGFTPAGVAP